jgi:hypothetical protein
MPSMTKVEILRERADENAEGDIGIAQNDK